MQGRRYQDEVSLREPPVHVKASFGFLGAIGVVINIVFFVVDIVSDALLAFVLWKQAQEEPNRSELNTWFIITLCIILVPMVVINFCSLLWYVQNKVCLGDYCVLHKMTKLGVVWRVLLHVLLLGQLARYMDVIKYGIKMKREKKHVEMGVRGGAIMRRTPRGEVYAVLHMVISRDAAMLDMIHSFLQDAPQLIFQIFLLYRRPDIVTGSLQDSPVTTAVQVWKVVLGVFAIAWSLVSYQDELRRSVPGKAKLGCCAVFTCLLWRAAMVASRVIAIGSFTAINTADDKSRSLLEVYMRENGTVHLPFPIITACVLLAHWLVMTAWIHAQGTNFCAGDEDLKRPLLELLYNCVMGVVHIFCYINVKDTPSRRRMAFYYTFCLLENTAMIAVWCVEMEPRFTSVLFRAGMVFSVEILWVVGLFCMVGYYAFLHPDKSNIGTLRNQASWRQ